LRFIESECDLKMKALFITLQWTPLLLVVSMFGCENTHSVALGLLL